jgi:hypothetical protein
MTDTRPTILDTSAAVPGTDATAHPRVTGMTGRALGVALAAIVALATLVALGLWALQSDPVAEGTAPPASVAVPVPVPVAVPAAVLDDPWIRARLRDRALEQTAASSQLDPWIHAQLGHRAGALDPFEGHQDDGVAAPGTADANLAARMQAAARAAWASAQLDPWIQAQLRHRAAQGDG